MAELLATLSLLLLSAGPAIASYHMDEMCGGEIALSEEPTRSLSLKLTSADEYDTNMNCYVTVTSDEGTRIMTSFIWIKINSFKHCPGDFVKITDIAIVNNKTLLRDSQEPRYCGTRRPDVTFVSRDNNVTVHFVSDSNFVGKGFHLLLTQFHQGECRDEEFDCDNGRCVHEDLVCDVSDLDHCGDHSDRCRLASGVIVSVTLASFVLVVVIFVLAVVLWFRCLRAKDDDDDEGGDDCRWTGRDNLGYDVREPAQRLQFTLPSISQLVARSNESCDQQSPPCYSDIIPNTTEPAATSTNSLASSRLCDSVDGLTPGSGSNLSLNFIPLDHSSTCSSQR